MVLVVEENKSASAKGKLGDPYQQPQRSKEIKVGDLIWEIGVGDRQRLNLGGQQRLELGDQRLKISGGSASLSLEFGKNLISPSLS